MINQYLKLVRAKNLLIIAITQYTMRYILILPMLKNQGVESQFSHLSFLILVLSTMLLAAAGYVINDYFDTQTDVLNRPKNVVVGKTIGRRTAMNFHLFLNLLGILAGFYISWSIGIWKLGYIYVLITALLWFYSSSFKRQFFIGNLIVAILTGIVPLMTALYEIPPINHVYAETFIRLGTNVYYLFFWVLGFSVFAFITTLTREIIKDIEDFEGDNAFGRRSLPIVLGVKTTKIIIISLIAITIGILAFVYAKYLTEIGQTNIIKYISPIYLLIFIVLPEIYLAVKTIKAESKEEWHFLSNFSKIIMLAGILYSSIIYMSF